MKFIRHGVAESNCKDCLFRDGCDKRPAEDQMVILSETSPPFSIKGELKVGRAILGYCNTGGKYVAHDLANMPEFSEPGNLGVHDLRIQAGVEVEIDFDAMYTAPDVPQDMTSAIRKWHGGTLN